MFFMTYLRRELRHRKKQAAFTAAGLAVAIALVISVASASAGAAKAQKTVLKGLYGVGTDITVTTPWSQAAAGPAHRIDPGATDQKMDFLDSPALGLMDASSLTTISRVRGVAAATGTLVLQDAKIDVPAQPGQGPSGSGLSTEGDNNANGPSLTLPTQINVDGVDTAHLSPGPLAGAVVDSGRALTDADAGADVALVSSDYAAANKLSVGSTVTLAKHDFKVVGIIKVPSSGNPRDVYIPLAPAQKLSGMTGKLNTVYVTAASADQVDAISKSISAAVPTANVTTASSLAGEVTGSLKDTAKLADNLGRWLSVAVLAAAFAVASLLTITSVSRRVREFGTLKALGWRTRRIAAQIMAESVTTGVLGAAAGVGLGLAGAAAISWASPALQAAVAASPGTAPPQGMVTSAVAGQAPVTKTFNAPDSVHTVLVHLTASVTVGAVVLAVILAVAGGVVAGLFGGWRAARMRPAEALARVE